MEVVESYRLFKSSSIDDLERTVNGKIRDGWQPYGQVVAYNYTASMSVTFVQTMVKYKQNNEKQLKIGE